MFAKKQDNFFSFYLPVYFLLKIFGIFLPSHQGNHRDGIFHITIFDKLWIGVIYCFLIVLAFLSNSVIGSFDFLMSNIWEVCTKFGLFVALFVLVFCHFKHSKIIEIFNEIKKFDEKVKFCSKS